MNLVGKYKSGDYEDNHQNIVNVKPGPKTGTK